MTNQARDGVRADSLRAAKILLGLFIAGALLACAGPLYGWLAIQYSGNLSSAQQINASALMSGFDFGPVYLRKGETCRYFLSAQMPETHGNPWLTTFEILDERRVPVFKQDELRLAGEYMFQPGQYDSYSKVFSLDRETGYYYFRYKAQNGSFSANPADPPVVKFAVRQGVIAGWALYAPSIGAFAVGLFIMLGSGISIRRRLMRKSSNRGFSVEEGTGEVSRRRKQRDARA